MTYIRHVTAENANTQSKKLWSGLNQWPRYVCMYASRSLGLNTVPYHIIQHASYTDTVTYADMEKRVRASNRLTQRHTRVTQLVKKTNKYEQCPITHGAWWHIYTRASTVGNPQRRSQDLSLWLLCVLYVTWNVWYYSDRSPRA